MRSESRSLTVSGDDGQLIERTSLTARRSAGSAWKVAPRSWSGGSPPAVVVVDRHVEAPRPPGEGLADPSHAEDPEALAGYVDPEHQHRVPPLPATASHETVSLRAPPGGRENAQHRGVRGRVGQDVGGVRDHDPDVPGRGHVDVLEPDGERGDDPDRTRHLLQHLTAETLRRAAHHRVVLAGGGYELLRRIDPIGIVPT